MIKFGQQVPSNYYTRSRDFQLLGRALECVLNSSKTYSDMIKYNTICKNTDIRLLDLLSKTAGFDVKRKYDSKDLYTLCSSFNSILQEKGTIKAVKDCVRVLLKSQNIDRGFDVIDVYEDEEDPETEEVIKVKKYAVNIYIPYEMTDVALLEDMLDYILPTGYIYNIIVVSGFISGIETSAAAVSEQVDYSIKYESKNLGNIFNPDGERDSHKTSFSVIYSEPTTNNNEGE